MLHVIFLVIIFSISTAVAAVGSKQNVLFILDGSGSMWGRVEEKPINSIAKDVMTKLVAQMDSETRVGLMTYGNR